MRSVESFVLSYLANSLWQIPLLFAAGWAAARLLRPLGAAAEHRVWVSVLVLQSLLPAGSALPWAWLRALFTWGGNAHRAGQVTVEMGPGTTLGGFHLPRQILTAVAIAYALVLAYFAARFLWRCAKLAALRRDAVEVALTGEAALDWERCAKRFGIEGVSIAASSRIFGPVTMGLRRKLVLLPPGMAAEQIGRAHV